MYKITNQHDVFLGKKLRAFRMKMDYPVVKLAFELGVSVQMIEHYEDGEYKIPATFLFKLAKILTIPFNSFFEGIENKLMLQLDEPVFNVLLVGNDPQDELFLRKAMKDFSKALNIYAINDGEQALSFLRNISDKIDTKFPKPNLILLDLNLISMDGLDILRDLKKRITFQNIPVIIMGNDDAIEDVSSSYRLNASGFINKSFSDDGLKNQYFKTLDYWANLVTLPI